MANQKFFKELHDKRGKDFSVLKDPDYSGVFNFIKDLYKKKTHFIYELLQNADDAKATEVTFELKYDKLVFKHNGKIHFDVTDPQLKENSRKGHINAITSIGASAKSGRINDADLKIGKFGIGFKSVFSFTLSPEIYDKNYYFKIKDFIIPISLDHDFKDRKSNETVFVFPFNNDEKSPQIAFNEIKEELSKLIHPLLFLNNLEFIHWSSPQNAGNYNVHFNILNKNDIIIEKFTETINKDERNGLKLSRLITDCDNQRHKYSIVFFLNKENNKVKYKSVYKAFCYFQTEVTTNLSFMIHAPFLITYNRATIKEDKWNQELIQLLSKLLTDSFDFFKEMGLMNESFFRALPLSNSSNNDGSTSIDITPFKKNIIKLLNYSRSNYFPSIHSTFLNKDNSFIARGKDLFELLTSTELSMLFDKQNSDWIFDSAKDNDFLYQFMISDINVHLIDQKSIPSVLNDEFLQKQPVKWLVKLYHYIKKDKTSLINSFKTKPIIRIQGDKFNSPPYDENLELQVYMPVKNETSMRIYKHMGLKFLDKEFLKMPEIKSFLHNQFNIISPDEYNKYAKIIEELPSDYFRDLSIDELKDFYKFIQNDKISLLDYLKTQPIIHVERELNNCKPYDENNINLVYFPSEGINSNTYFCEFGHRLIDKRLMDDPDTKSFLEQHLSITEPDKASYFINILKQKFNQKGHEAFKKLKGKYKNDYINFISDLCFYTCTNIDDSLFKILKYQPFLIGIYKSEKMLEVGKNLYFPYPFLKEFLKYENIVWLDDTFYSDLFNGNINIEDFELFAKESGVQIYPKLINQGHDVLGLNNYIKNCRKFNQSKTILYWLEKLLKDDIIQDLEGTDIISLLNKLPWLFDKEEKGPYKPENIIFENLHLDYNQFNNKELSYIKRFLQFKQLDTNESKERLNTFVDLLAEKGLNQNEVIDCIQKMIENPRKFDNLQYHEILDFIDEFKPSENEISDFKKHITFFFSQGRFDNHLDEEDEESEFDNSQNFDVEIKKSLNDIGFGSDFEDLKRRLGYKKKYSYEWFVILIRMEIVQSGFNSKKNPIKVSFDKIEPHPRSKKMIILRNNSNYIPSVVENLADFKLTIISRDYPNKSVIDVDSVSKRIEKKGNNIIHKLIVKLKFENQQKESLFKNLNFNNVVSIYITIKDPVFIFNELLNNFCQIPDISKGLIKIDSNFQQLLKSHIKKLSFIYGPPGTGKTTFVAEKIICDILDCEFKYEDLLCDPEKGIFSKSDYDSFKAKKDSLKILVMTPTNKAADVLAEKIVELWETKNNSDYKNYMIRFETTDSEKLEHKALDTILERGYDIKKKKKFVTITTIHRYSYDGFKGEKNQFRNFEWDLIIFDEASMITISSIVNVLYRSYFLNPDCLFIISGDPNQIPPIQKVDIWSDENIYSMTSLSSFNPLKQEEEMIENIGISYPVFNLITQFRSTQNIGNLFSHFSYDSLIEHYRDNKKQVLPELEIDLDDFTIFNYPSNNSSLLFKPGRLKKSPYHPYSVIFSIILTEYLINKLENTDKTISIGIICPYRVQADLVSKLITVKKLNRTNIDVHSGTIHSFQGDECDIIICLFNTPARINDKIFLNRKNILNVAISRAKDYLIIIKPDERTNQYRNLYQLKRIINLINSIKTPVIFDCEKIETILKEDSYIATHTFITSHQLVNVYTSLPENDYEFRINEDAIDIQVLD